MSMFVLANCILIGLIYFAHADLQQKFNLLEKKVENLEDQLEYGGKQYQSISYSEWTNIMYCVHISLAKSFDI